MDEWKSVRVTPQVHKKLCDIQTAMKLTPLAGAVRDVAEAHRAKDGGWPLGGIVAISLDILEGLVASAAEEAALAKSPRTRLTERERAEEAEREIAAAGQVHIESPATTDPPAPARKRGRR